jgi:hypothetical protein
MDPSRLPRAAIISPLWPAKAVGGNGKAPAVDHGGRYEDVHVRTPEGWRIKSRRYVQLFPPQ